MSAQHGWKMYIAVIPFYVQRVSRILAGRNCSPFHHHHLSYRLVNNQANQATPALYSNDLADLRLDFTGSS
jgi:hypothetical protein